MTTKKFPRYLVVIAIGLVLLAGIYLILLPLFKPTAYVLIAIGLLHSLMSESARRKYAQARKHYYEGYLTDSLHGRNYQLIVTKDDGTQATLSTGKEIKAYTDFDRQQYSRAAFADLVLGLSYSLVGLSTLQLNGLIKWIVYIVVFIPIIWNILIQIVRPLLYLDTLRQEHFNLLFGKTVSDPLEGS